MSIRLLQTDVLDSETEVLLVTAGTEKPPPGRRSTDVLGTVGAQLLRRVGPELAEELEEQLPVPLDAGTAEPLELSPNPHVKFKHVLVLGALSHLPGANHRANIRRSLLAAFEEAKELKASAVALALPRGGWRTDAATAAWALLDVTNELQGLRVDVHCMDPRDFEVARGILGAG